MRIYYWEHQENESRWMRSRKAQDIAELAHAQPNSEIGVIIDNGDKPVCVYSVPRARTIVDTAKALVNGHNVKR